MTKKDPRAPGGFFVIRAERGSGVRPPFGAGRRIHVALAKMKGLEVPRRPAPVPLDRRGRAAGPAAADHFAHRGAGASGGGAAMMFSIYSPFVERSTMF
jgi:hypothetical protein